MNERLITTKAELLADINQNWGLLHEALNRLDESQLTDIRDAQGWSVKDHLIHMTAWERSAVFLLQGKPRHEGLGIDETLYLNGDEDSINAAIHDTRKGQSLADTLTQFREVHGQLLRLLEPMTDADLQNNYRHFLPDEPGEGDGPPVINVVYGNSAHHFAEHQRWIEWLVES